MKKWILPIPRISWDSKKPQETNNKTMTNPLSKSEISVGLGDRSYTITVQPGLLDRVGEYACSQNLQSPIPIIADETVSGLYGQRVVSSLRDAGYETQILSFPPGEASKNLDTVARLYDGMVKINPERKSGVIALGGGVTGDIAGFVAATYLRGIRFIQIPTTLLADVDSSVGGKVGVDHSGGKNLIGAFHQPVAVLIDPNTLQSLDRKQIRAGLAEVIKHGIIADADLFNTIRAKLISLLAIDRDEYCQIIPWNCRIKAHVVEQDERENGLRAILNFGHTYGHAIESLTGYKQFLHGEAVAIGMLMEAQLGCKLGITPFQVVVEIRDMLKNAGFPLAKPEIPADALLNGMLHDKKVEKGKLRFVLPVCIGQVVIHPVEDLDGLREIWNDYREISS